MVIQSIRFVKSSADLKSCPKPGPPEYAFAGRSNVGKSSLLNMLANIKNLAKTSSSPGKTRLINHFLVNDNWYLVDLPGYGFARTDRKTRESFLQNIGNYLVKRDTLACLFILLDSRHKPLGNDLEFINWAGNAGIPVCLVFTKADKVSETVLSKNLGLYRNTLLQTWEEVPPLFVTSSSDQKGRDEILKFIEKSNKAFNN